MIQSALTRAITFPVTIHPPVSRRLLSVPSAKASDEGRQGLIAPSPFRLPCMRPATRSLSACQQKLTPALRPSSLANGAQKEARDRRNRPGIGWPSVETRRPRMPMILGEPWPQISGDKLKRKHIQLLGVSLFVFLLSVRGVFFQRSPSWTGDKFRLPGDLITFN